MYTQSKAHLISNIYNYIYKNICINFITLNAGGKFIV